MYGKKLGLDSISASVERPSVKMGSDKVVELFDERFFVSVSITTPPDRHGSVGYVDFDVDWRPKQYEVNFVFQPDHGDRALNYFDDDHRRAISEELGTGSRDQRVFFLQSKKDQERREKRKKLLLQEMQKLETFLQKELPPARIAILKTVSREGKMSRDNDGKMQDDSYNIVKRSWNEYPELQAPVFSAGRSVYQFTLAEQQLGEEADQKLFDEGNRVATDVYLERINDLLKKESRHDIVAAFAKYKRIREELALFDGTYLINVPVLIASKESKNPDFSSSVKANGGLYDGMPPTVYTPALLPDRLENFGSKGTYLWYGLQGVDVSQPAISFPAASGGQFVPSLQELRSRQSIIASEPVLERSGPSLPKRERAPQASAESEPTFEPASKPERIVLDPETLKEIVSLFERAKALLCIVDNGFVDSNPFSSVERELQKKILVRQMRLHELESQLRDQSLLPSAKEELELLYKKVIELVQQKAIVQARPGFGKAVHERIASWNSISDQVSLSPDCRMLVEESASTLADLIHSVRERYLQNPQNQTVDSCIDDVVAKVIEGIPV